MEELKCTENQIWQCKRTSVAGIYEVIHMQLYYEHNIITQKAQSGFEHHRHKLRLAVV